MNNSIITSSHAIFCVFSLLLIGNQTAFAQNYQDPWATRDSFRLAQGNRPLEKVSKATYSTYDGEKSSYFFLSADPTYLYAEAKVSDDYGDYKGSRNYFGATVTFGYQFNAWNQLKVDLGVLVSDKLKVRYSEWDYDGNLVKGSFKVPTSQILIPTTLSYNSTFPLIKNRLNLGFGPSIGYAEVISRSYEGLESKTRGAFIIGGGISLNYFVTNAFFTGLSGKYMHYSDAGEHGIDESMNTYSVSMSFGWWF